MLGGPAGERVAAVLVAGSQGSGYLIEPRLVLTAAHVVRRGGDIRIAAVGGLGFVDCDLVWSGHEDDCDAALLRAREDILPQGLLTSFRGLNWGKPGSLTPVSDCQAIGFAPVQGSASGRSLDTEQITGALRPGAGLLSGSYVLTPQYLPATPGPWSSPWAGMSGAAVFAEDVFIGIITSHPENRPNDLRVLPAAALLDQPGLISQLHARPRLLTLSPDLTFERRYADYLEKRHSYLAIFGLDLNDRSRQTWPLDEAYLELRATETVQDAGALSEPAPRVPVEQALTRHPRILLRGEAGSGKTTLVQRLVVTAARQDPESRYLQDRVPFLLPLRTLVRQGELPLPEEFLSTTRSPLAGTQPAGWVDRVLTAGRGLLLVDGVDEIAEHDRARVKSWLTDLLTAFPANYWLITSRPSAVDDAWLAEAGFTSYAVSRMSDDDIVGFITRWHDAARAVSTDPQQAVLLDEFEARLLTTFHSSPTLRRLATSPLMCSLVCALHTDRRGSLPSGEIELYQAALSMLLSRRDRERGIDVSTQLSEQSQLLLLGRIAYWLVRNGRMDAPQEAVVQLIDEALPALPVADDARSLFDLLLARSGLLNEPAAGMVSFVSRTLRDYLAARAVVAEGDFDLLVRNADDVRWEDVFRFAVAQSRPSERAELLTRLLSRGETDVGVSSRLTLLALSCLEFAFEIDPSVRQEVLERAARLLPPRTDAELEALARVGSSVLDLLPSPGTVTRREAATFAGLVRRVGGSEHLVQEFVTRSKRPAPALTSSVRVPADLSPGAYELAVALSVATRVEPELLRAVRLTVFPYLDVAAESDLWFSDWVASRTPSAIALRPELLPGLREALAEKIALSPADDPITDLWDVISRVHADLSPALALEERVAWLYVQGDLDPAESIDQALQPALRALVSEGRDGIADWLAGAWERLPEPVRSTTTAWQLATLASPRASGLDLSELRTPDDLRIEDAAVVAEGLADVPLPVSLAGDELLVGTASGGRAVAVPVPDTHPRMIEVMLDGGSHPEVSVRTVMVADGQAVTVPIGDTRVRLRTARGLTYVLREGLGTAGTTTGEPPPGAAHEFTAPDTLPPAPTRLIGREEELARLMHALDPTLADAGRPTALSVSGLAGVGKTTLALAAAHDARMRGWFPGGTVFLDLHGDKSRRTTTSDAVHAVLRALGVTAADIPEGSDDRVFLYHSVLAERMRSQGPVLIVADNASTNAQVQPLLPRDPLNRAIVTSRAALPQLDASFLRLGRLKKDEAHALLHKATSTADPSDTRLITEPTSVEQLAELCDGLPLALRIAAAILVSDPGMPVASLVDELSDPATRVDRLDDGELSVRAAFESSHRRLSKDQAQLLRLLAGAPSAALSTTAIAVLLPDRPVPASQLNGLVRYSFVDRETGADRWRMSDLVRAFVLTRRAEKQARPNEDEEAWGRLLEYYVHMTEHAVRRVRSEPEQTVQGPFSNAQEAQNWLGDEWKNLASTAFWAARGPHARTTMRLSLALAEYLREIQAFQVLTEVSRVALDAAQRVGDLDGEARAWGCMGIGLRGLSDFTGAIEAFTHERDVYQNLGDRSGESRAWHSLGTTHTETGTPDEALRAFSMAVELCQELGEWHGVARSSAAWAEVLHSEGLVDEAQSMWTLAADAYHRVGALEEEASVRRRL
ncbi:NACHT domain-containing protein [Streptomyces sp. ME02-8801-2C]|uniref:NACHT domain-containing protein n=1 Tax=Streptomyces sp. ME02-8801-2C TaxID=3028680 RepID=UPI0029A239EF|nr:NACHT domain-containing protein [Streptomyces sp. ME02-8801-2C]MDX3454533.1 NACHT domain-containing protein [Streptomyces sp. ME02-8801-2C]